MRMFWGILFLIIGTSMILDHVFGIDLPLFRIAFALWLIYWGVKILFGGFGINFTTNKIKTDSEILFSEGRFEYPAKDSKKMKSNSEDEYVTIFGKSSIDFSQLEPGKKIEVEFATVFGKTEILVPTGRSVKLVSDVVFGSVEFPNRSTSAFGKTSFQTEPFNEAEAIIIHADAVFGQILIIQK